MNTRFYLLGSILLGGTVATRAEPANPKVIERYKQMLASNPAEGVPLDRLWKIYLDQNQTAELLAQYAGGGTFPTEMVHGHLLRKAGRAADSSAAYQRAAQLDAQSPLPWIALAHLRTEQGQHEDAAKSLERAIAALPADAPQRLDLLGELGAAWLAANDLAKAAETWERAIATDPANLVLRRKLVQICLQNHLPERAIPHLAFIEQHAPPQERAQALQQLARIYQVIGDQDRAIAALDRALLYTAPGNWLRNELQSQLIRLHQRYHRLVELEERWTKNARENARDIAAYLQLIDLYERTGQLENERVWLEKLIAVAPKSADYRARLARLHVQMDAPDKAAEVFDQLLKEQPGNVDLVFERARIEVQTDKLDAAKSRIAAFLSTHKKDEAVRSRALDFYQAHRLDDLIEAQLKADAASGSEEAILALTNFYFTQHREEEARVTANLLVPAKLTGEARAAAFSRQAQLFRTQNELPAAADALRKAIELTAQPRELWALLGETEAARGNLPEARAAYEQMVARSTSSQEFAEADQKLFESLRSEPAEKDGSRATARSANLASKEPSATLQSYLLGITRGVAEKPSVDGWLRVARWHQWSQNTRSAMEYAQKALALDPKSIPVHEFLVKVASAEPSGTGARKYLEALIQLEPARQIEHQRRIGQLELQAGHVDEAARIFTALAKQTPGNVEVLTDLASTQQRAEQWDQALLTWQQIYALTPPARRKEVTGPLTRLYDRLKQPQQAAELLLKQMDALGDEKEQLAAFQELLTFSAQRNLLPWLREEFEKRLKLRGEDYFTEIALGRILKLSGNKAAAFEVLADASFSTANQAQALPDLVREAEELRKLDAAIRLQTQFLRVVPQETPAGYAKLAQLQEKNADPEGAAKTWEKAVAKFPRDAAHLQLAIDFQLRWGTPTRAAQWLRRLRGLEPANLRALAELARLDLAAGETAEAQSCLEQILARSTPVPGSEPLRIPGVRLEDAGSLQRTYLTTVRSRRGRPAAEVLRALRSFWAEGDPPVRSDREIRLGAIRDLGKLVHLQNEPAALAAWVQRWRDPKVSATETLWALYFAGANGPLVEHAAGLLDAAPDDSQAKQAFIWLTLQTGEFDRLSAWLQDRRRTPAERDYLLVALSQYLQAPRGQLDPALLPKLFPAGYKLRLWQAAALFATHGYFREATQLGERLFRATSTQRAGYGLELAHWHLSLGAEKAARKILQDCAAESGDAFSSPVYAALRASYLLLPEGERAAFVEAFTRSVDPQKLPLHAALSGALLAGLAGQENEAFAQLDRLLNLGAMADNSDDENSNSASRYWDLVLANGAQLQAWKLDRLAAHLWEKALADPALITLSSETQGKQILARTDDIRARLTALRLVRASGFDAAAILEKFEREAGPDNLSAVSDSLKSIGAAPQAMIVDRALWEREPANAQALRNLLSACRTAHDPEMLEQVLGRCVREGIFRGNDPAHRDFVLQLADTLEARGAGAEARTVLSAAVEHAPNDTRLLRVLAALHQRTGHPAEAEASYVRLMQLEPGNVPVRIEFTRLLEAQNRVPAAIELLEKTTGPDVDARLVQLYFKVGRLDELFPVFERIAPPQQLTAALELANAFAGKGEAKMARNVLRQAMNRSTETIANLPLQSRLIELLPEGFDRAALSQEFERLRRIAGEQSDLQSACFDLLLRETARLKCEAEFARELTDEWDNGAGSLAAGTAIFALQARQKDHAAANATFTRLLARNDLSEPLCAKLIQSADEAQLPELALQARARFARLAPQDTAQFVAWISALKVAGKTPEALRALEELSCRAVLSDEVAAQCAKLFAELNQPERARTLFAQATSGDPMGRNFRAHLDYANFLLAAGEVGPARQHLRTAFQNPANSEFGELVAFLKSAGRLPHFEREIAGFNLRPQRLSEVRRVLFAELEKARDMPAVVALFSEHPELLGPGTSARLRALALASGAPETGVALLERLLAQTPPEASELKSELAALYAELAKANLGTPLEDAGLAHLQRAHELKPDGLPIAQSLAELLKKRGDIPGAARALQDFLSASADAAEKEKARQLLAAIER